MALADRAVDPLHNADRFLRDHESRWVGEMEKIKHCFPKDMQTLWADWP